MPAKYMGRDDKWFQENMGNGAVMISSFGRKDSKSDISEKPGGQAADSQQPKQKTPETEDHLNQGGPCP